MKRVIKRSCFDFNPAIIGQLEKTIGEVKGFIEVRIEKDDLINIIEHEDKIVVWYWDVY